MVIIFNIKAVYQALRRDCAATAKNIIDYFIHAEILLDNFHNFFGNFFLTALVRQSDRTAFSDFLLIKFQHARSQKSRLKTQAVKLNFKIYWVSLQKMPITCTARLASSAKNCAYSHQFPKHSTLCHLMGQPSIGFIKSSTYMCIIQTIASLRILYNITIALSPWVYYYTHMDKQ